MPELFDKPAKEKFNYPGIYDRSAPKAPQPPQIAQPPQKPQASEKPQPPEKPKKAVGRKPLKLTKKLE